MAVNSKKIDVKNLVKGMYISKLDRPWIETSYPIEGFYIQDESDIQALKAQCRHVYIDVDLTKLRVDIQQLQISGSSSSPPGFSIQSLPEDRERLNQGKSPAFEKKTFKQARILYVERVPFEKEFKTANKLYETITQTASEILTEASAGNTIDVEKVNQTASMMVDSIIRNPDAFLWLSRLKAKDTHTHNRSIRATIWAIAFGRYLSLPRQELSELSIAVLLSNIGKARLPRELLEKSDSLTDTERKVYLKHVSISVELIKEMGMFSKRVMDIVASHCERHDGSGYPRRLKGDEINFPAQVAGLVTYYEKITNFRDKEKSLDATRAMEHLYKLRGSKFQAELVEEFIQSIGIYPAGSLIELNSREIAVIVEQNDHHRLLPKVMILRDKNKNPVATFKILDLSTINTDSPNAPKIINSIPLGSYGIGSQEIIDNILKADKNWIMKKLFS